MTQHIEQARRQLGDLAAMAHQTIEMERKILQRAQALITEVAKKMDKARAEAMSGDDTAKQAYMDLVMEQGRLNQVIAQAQAALVD